MINGILVEGFIYGIMVLGVFITFRILNFCDMTVDGSFPMGAAIMAEALVQGLPSPLAMLLAFAGGCLAGLVTALIHTRLKVPDLLAGILTMTMLWSVNLRIMENRANLSLLGIPNTFSRLNQGSAFGMVIYCGVIVLVIMLILDIFFHTDFGMTLGALGANPQLIISQGMNPDMLKIFGVSLSNGMTGVAGALAAMYQGFADVGLGTGTIVAGLASLMIGEFLIRSNRISMQLLRALLGSLIYRALMYLARDYGYYIHMTANDFKLVTGLLIIVCLLLSRTGFRKGYRSRARKTGGKK
jgi:putative ABC transport system permease protein